jgi:hypothetical protein
MKEKPKFDRVESPFKGVKAYKPNDAMQLIIAKDMEKTFGRANMPPAWRKLLDAQDPSHT